MGDVLRTPIDDSLVYRKSGLGVAQLAVTHGGVLSLPARRVLILLDGRRTIAELSELFGAEVVQRLIPELEASGFAKRVDPQLSAELANVITQLFPPVPGRSSQELDEGSDAHPLAWIAVWTVLAILGSYWATNRTQADASWHSNQTLAQVLPIDTYRAPTSTDAIDASEPEAITVTPISGLPAVPASKPAAGALPAHPAPRPLVRGRRAIDGAESRGALPVAARTPAPRAPAVAHFAAAAAVKVDMPAARPSNVQVATAASPAPGPAEAPNAELGVAPGADSPGATPMPAPVETKLDHAPATELAVAAAPPPQAASDLVTLRPLRHDPPQFPASALLDGVLESQVRVRLWVTPEGKVDQVDIIEAKPARVLDDEVRRALSLWTFEPPGRPTEEVIDLTLKP